MACPSYSLNGRKVQTLATRRGGIPVAGCHPATTCTTKDLGFSDFWVKFRFMNVLLPKLVAGLTLLAAIPLAPAQDNLCENPDFEGETERWSISGPSGSYAVSETGPEGARALTFTLPEEGGKRFSFFQNTDLSLAEKYRVSFFARSDKPLTILVGPQRGEGNYGSIGDGSTTTIGPEWKLHRLNITVREGTTLGRLVFLPIDPVPGGTVQFARFQFETVP